VPHLRDQFRQRRSVLLGEAEPDSTANTKAQAVAERIRKLPEVGQDQAALKRFIGRERPLSVALANPNVVRRRKVSAAPDDGDIPRGSCG
jgi:hypothetical protein